MSHMLTRLVDRVYGYTPRVGPVRTPLFNDISTASGEKPSQQRSDFTYSDLIRSQQGLSHPFPSDAEGMSHPVARHEEGVAIPITPAQSLHKRGMDTIARPDENVTVTPDMTTHRVERDITVSPTRVGSHSDRVVEAAKTRTTELSPVAARRQQVGENQVSQSDQEQYPIDTNRFLPSYAPVESNVTEQKIVTTKPLGDSEQFTSPTQSSFLQPRVTSRRSVTHNNRLLTTYHGKETSNHPYPPSRLPLVVSTFVRWVQYKHSQRKSLEKGLNLHYHLMTISSNAMGDKGEYFPGHCRRDHHADGQAK